MTEHSYEVAPVDQKDVDKQLSTINSLSLDQIGSYGNDAQTKIAGYADDIMHNVQTRDVGEVGDQLTQLSLALKKTDTNQKGNFLMRIFKKTKETAMTKATLYNNINNVVDGIDNTLKQQIEDLNNSNETLAKFNENIREYVKELDVRITAGRQKLKQLQDVDLANAEKAKAEYNTVEAEQRIADIQDQISAWQNRLIDLEESYQVANAELVQIRVTRQTNRGLISKIQTNQQNIVPLWRMMSVSQLAQLQQKDIVEKSQVLKETTEEMLTSSSKMTHDSALEIAKMNNEASIDVEKVKEFKNTLNDTINDLINANSNVQQQRQKTLDELSAMRKKDVHEEVRQDK